MILCQHRKGVKKLSKVKYEKRMHSIATLEARPIEEDKPKILEGYAAVFNQRGDVDGHFDEIILPGAFANTLATKKDILALVNHNFDNVLGRTSNGLLHLYEDDHGLKFELTLPDTAKAHQTYEDVQCGNLKDCSFLFFNVDEEWDYSGEKPLCTLKEVDLIEISIVSVPVYEGTEVSARSKAKANEGALKKKLTAKINQLLEENRHE